MVEVPNKGKSIVELLAMPKEGASQGTSAAVRSNQQGLHGGLARAVRRHGASVWRKPARPADEAALARLDQAMGGAAPKPTPPKPTPPKPAPAPQKPEPQKPEPAPKPPAPKPPAPKKEERIDGILIEREDTGPRR